jgi:hypothetical protein
VAGSGHVAKASDGSVVLEQAKSSTSVVSVVGPKASSPQRLGSLEQKLKLPWLVVDSQARDTYSVVRSAQPFIKLARAVQWDAEHKLHIAEVLIGLDAESGDGGALAEPLVASLAVSCDSVEPQSVRFTTIGSAGDQLVRVACSPQVKNERAEHTLSLRLRGAEYSYAFEIPHRPGRFELQASTSTVLGMGLGELTLTVLQLEEDGTELVAREPIVVPLHVDEGELSPDSLTIAAGAAQGSVTVHLRGNGALQVRAGLGEREFVGRYGSAWWRARWVHGCALAASAWFASGWSSLCGCYVGGGGVYRWECIGSGIHVGAQCRGGASLGAYCRGSLVCMCCVCWVFGARVVGSGGSCVLSRSVIGCSVSWAGYCAAISGVTSSVRLFLMVRAIDWRHCFDAFGD